MRLEGSRPQPDAGSARRTGAKGRSRRGRDARRGRHADDRGLPIPKMAPADAAKEILDGFEAGEEEIYVGEMARGLAARPRRTIPRGSNGSSLRRASIRLRSPHHVVNQGSDHDQVEIPVCLSPRCDQRAASPVSADLIPGLRGHDHTGITVPDVKAATAFFTDVIGCEHAMSFGPFIRRQRHVHAGRRQRQSARGHRRDQHGPLRLRLEYRAVPVQIAGPGQDRAQEQRLSAAITSRSMSTISTRPRTISSPRTSGPCRGRSRSRKVPRPASRSCIS